MTKRKFKQVVDEGINRRKDFMAVKIKGSSDRYTRVVIVQREDITPGANKYCKLTNDDMVFKDSCDQVVDVLLTSNLNDLSWFAY